MDIHKIKFSGTTEIDYPLDLKKDYSVVLKRCAIKSANKKLTEEDEGSIYTYSMESLDEATLICEGQTIKGSAKSASKKLRGAIWHKAEELGIEDFEKFYQETVTKIIIDLDKIIN